MSNQNQLTAEEKFYVLRQGSMHEGGSATHYFRSLNNAIFRAKELMNSAQQQVNEIWGEHPEYMAKFSWHEVEVKNEKIKFNAENAIDEIMVIETQFDD